MASFTTRLGLTKPAGTEDRAVGPLNTNSDLIDKFLPCILVNDGVTPPTGDLYDGALVKERNSGILWEARKNGGGTFDKVYVRYPFHFQGNSSSAQSIGNSSGDVQVDIAAVNASYCKNASVGNISSNRFTAPVKGIYSFAFRLNWAQNGTGDRFLNFRLNNATVTSGGEYAIVRAASSIGGAGQVNTLDLMNTTILGVGDQIAPGAQQTSGGPLNVSNTYVKICLLEPVQ